MKKQAKIQSKSQKSSPNSSCGLTPTGHRSQCCSQRQRRFFYIILYIYVIVIITQNTRARARTGNTPTPYSILQTAYSIKSTRQKKGMPRALRVAARESERAITRGERPVLLHALPRSPTPHRLRLAPPRDEWPMLISACPTSARARGPTREQRSSTAHTTTTTAADTSRRRPPPRFRRRPGARMRSAGHSNVIKAHRGPGPRPRGGGGLRPEASGLRGRNEENGHEKAAERRAITAPPLTSDVFEAIPRSMAPLPLRSRPLRVSAMAWRHARRRRMHVYCRGRVAAGQPHLSDA